MHLIIIRRNGAKTLTLQTLLERLKIFLGIFLVFPQNIVIDTYNQTKYFFMEIINTFKQSIAKYTLFKCIDTSKLRYGFR